MKLVDIDKSNRVERIVVDSSMNTSGTTRAPRIRASEGIPAEAAPDPKPVAQTATISLKAFSTKIDPPPRQPVFRLLDLPVELVTEIQGNLDRATAHAAARTSAVMRGVAQANNSIKGQVDAHFVMQRLKSLLASPSSTHVDFAALEGHLRKASAYLQVEDIEDIVKAALFDSQGDYALAGLLGPSFSSRSVAEAQDLANELEGIEVHGLHIAPIHRPALTRELRSEVLVRIMCGLGNAHPSIYEPFLRRLRSDDYVSSYRHAEGFAEIMGTMPGEVRGEICSIILDKEQTEQGLFDNTMAMSQCLADLPPLSRQSVFEQARKIWSAATRHDREMMADCFHVDLPGRFDGLLPPVERQWRALFAS